jgi:hypothetical protein
VADQAPQEVLRGEEACLKYIQDLFSGYCWRVSFFKLFSRKIKVCLKRLSCHYGACFTEHVEPLPSVSYGEKTHHVVNPDPSHLSSLEK